MNVFEVLKLALMRQKSNYTVYAPWVDWGKCDKREKCKLIQFEEKKMSALAKLLIM